MPRAPNRPPAPIARFPASVLLLCAVLGTLLGAPRTAPAQEEAFTESVVIFNTVCAKCHEAQCSGRLSFDSRYESAVRHIVRHYGPAAGKAWLQKELFAILDYMKRHCAYYPMDVPLPPKRVWGPEMLQRFGTLLEHDYFIPLGPMEAGAYRLELQLAEATRVTVQLVDASFEMVVDECRTPDGTGLTLPFRLEQAGELYFRLYTDRPVALTRLAVDAAS